MSKKFLKIALLSTLGFVATNGVSASDLVLGRMVEMAEAQVTVAKGASTQLTAVNAFSALSKALVAEKKTSAKLGKEVATLTSSIEAVRVEAASAHETAVAELRSAHERALGALAKQIEELTEALKVAKAELTAAKEANADLEGLVQLEKDAAARAKAEATASDIEAIEERIEATAKELETAEAELKVAREAAERIEAAQDAVDALPADIAAELTNMGRIRGWLTIGDTAAIMDALRDSNDGGSVWAHQLNIQLRAMNDDAADVVDGKTAEQKRATRIAEELVALDAHVVALTAVDTSEAHDGSRMEVPAVTNLRTVTAKDQAAAAKFAAAEKRVQDLTADLEALNTAKDVLEGFDADDASSQGSAE